MSRIVWGGRYVAFDELASGGMATVYLAGRLDAGSLPRVVAVKKMFEQFAKQPEFVTMFLDEAHLATQIRHANVVTTYEVLRIPDSLAIVMDFVLGVSLVDLLRQAPSAGPAPIAVTAAILEGVLSGLHAAHEATDEKGRPFGLVHRDMSPHNVIVGKDGTARIIDFGIAKAAGRLQVTEAGVMKGKFAYMAPEQIRGSGVDRRTDIYSTGIVLWETLTGEQLFGGATDASIFAKRAAGQMRPAPPSSLNPAVPLALDSVVERALEPDAAARFATAKEMAAAIARAVPPAPVASVAAWVQSLAGARLTELAEMARRVEASFKSGEMASYGKVESAAASAPLPAGDVPDLVLPAPRASAPSLASSPAPAARSSNPSLGAQAAAPPRAPGAPPRAVAPPVAPSSKDMFDDDDGPALRLDLETDLASKAVAPRTSSPALGVRRATTDARFHEQVAERRPRRGAGLLVLLVLLLGAGAAVAVFGPPALKSYVIGAAARRGVTLSADRIEPRAGGLTLYGVEAHLSSSPAVATLKAPEVDVAVDWQGALTSVYLPGYDLTVRGRAQEVGAAVVDWLKQPFVPTPVEAKAGHVAWNDILGPGTAVDAVNVLFNVGGHDEPSFLFETPNLGVHLSHGELGPWHARLSAMSSETKLTIGLDRSLPEGPPSVTFVARPAVGQTLGIVVAHAKPAEIGIPADVLHVAPTVTIDVNLDAQVFPTGQPLQAHAMVALHGLAMPTPGLPPLTDLVAEGEVSGDTSEMLPIQHAKLTLGKAVTEVTGRFAMSADGIRAEMDRPAAKGTTTLLAVDTRDWTSNSASTASATPSPAPSAVSSARHR